MADHAEDLGARVSALDARVDKEVTAVQEHFVELQQFITFSLGRLVETLRSEDLKPIERRLGTVEYRLETMDRRFDRLDQRFDSLEDKVDAHHAATQTALRDIVSRLEGKVAGVEDKVTANHAATQKVLEEILNRLPKHE